MRTLNSILRARFRQRVVVGDWFTRESGPIILVDNALWSNPDTSPGNRLSTTHWLRDDQNMGPGLVNYVYGPHSDELVGPDSSGNFVPDGQLQFGSSWTLAWGPRYDESRDVIWLTGYIDGLPLYGRDPLATEYLTLPPNGLNGDTVGVEYETVSDTSTKYFPYFRDRGVSVHNAAVMLRYRCEHPFTLWVKATQWSHTFDTQTRKWVWTITDSGKYLRIDIYGAETALLSSVQSQQLLGLPYTEADALVASLDGTVFEKFTYELEEYRFQSMDKANRGVMDLWVTIIEGHKSVKLIKDLVAHLRKGLRPLLAIAISQSKLTKRQKVRLLGHKWLEYRYGWRQFIFDGQGLLRLFASFFKRMRRSYTSGNTRAGKFISSDETDEIVCGNGTFTISYIGTASLRAGVSVDPNLSDRWYKKFYQLVGGVNPFTVAWELTKLSWVVDWIIDVGSLLSVLTRNPARFIRAWHTISMPVDGGQFTIHGELAQSDLYGPLADAVGENWEPFGLTLIQLFLNDEEEIFSPLSMGGKCRVYLRIPLDPTRYPLVVPQGILIKSGSQIADLISLFAVARR